MNCPKKSDLLSAVSYNNVQPNAIAPMANERLPTLRLEAPLFFDVSVGEAAVLVAVSDVVAAPLPDDDVLVELEFASKVFFSLFSGYWNLDASRLAVQSPQSTPSWMIAVAASFASHLSSIHCVILNADVPGFARLSIAPHTHFVSVNESLHSGILSAVTQPLAHEGMLNELAKVPEPFAGGLPDAPHCASAFAVPVFWALILKYGKGVGMLICARQSNSHLKVWTSVLGSTLHRHVASVLHAVTASILLKQSDMHLLKSSVWSRLKEEGMAPATTDETSAVIITVLASIVIICSIVDKFAREKRMCAQRK